MRYTFFFPITIALAIACATPRCFAAPSYAINDLGTLGGPTYGEAINASGQVTGVTKTSSGYHAFIYSDGTLTDINPSGAAVSIASSINASGQVAGYAVTSSQAQYGFLYSEGLTINLNSSLGWGTNSVNIHAINDAGDMIGSGFGHSFLYSNGTLHYLDTNGGFGINALNNASQVAGYSVTGGYRALLYTNGLMQNLGLLDPNPVSGSFSEAIALNNTGQVVGISSVHGGGNAHLFLYANNSMSDLGVPSLASDVGPLGPTGINDTGEIIGYYTDALSQAHAFLYVNGVYTDLNSLIDHTSGWTSLQANGINDSGEIIGSGINSQGQTHALLFTIIPAPEPESIAIIGFVAVQLIITRPRRCRV